MSSKSRQINMKKIKKKCQLLRVGIKLLFPFELLWIKSSSLVKPLPFMFRFNLSQICNIDYIQVKNENVSWPVLPMVLF